MALKTLCHVLGYNARTCLTKGCVSSAEGARMVRMLELFLGEESLRAEALLRMEKRMLWWETSKSLWSSYGHETARGHPSSP